MGKRKPAISIIVPLYNVSKYITFCMDSILKQTFQDFEIILVDDVSTDNTYEICKRLYEPLECVTLIRNPVNKGQWYARNMGITQARGKYIYFMDDDDELLPEAMEILYNKAEAEQADAVHCNFYEVVYSEERMLPRKSLWRHCKCRDTQEGLLTGNLPKRLEYQAGGSMPMPWLNLYNREFLVREKIEFPQMCFGEDNIFAIDVCLKAKRYVRINKPLYIYRNYFDQKGRMVRRFPKAFGYVPIFMEGWNRIFSAFTEEELPFAARRTFISQWLMAHLRFCVYDIMHTNDEDAFLKMRQYLQPVCAGGEEFTAYLINIVENYVGFRGVLTDEKKHKRENAGRFFADMSRGRGNFIRDYSYVYCEAKLAAYTEEGNDDYYFKAYYWLANASLELGRYQEALEAYKKAVSYAVPGSEEFIRAAGKRLAVQFHLEGCEADMAECCSEYKEALQNIVPFAHSGRKSGWGSKKIRIGVLSPYFYAHDSFAIYYGLLFCYDKEQFEVFCYHCGTAEDEYTAAVRSQVDKFVGIERLSYQDRAELIYNDEVDFLIDMSGRYLEEALPVLAYRPARVQIGDAERLPLAELKLMDYYLVDDVIMPAQEGKRHGRQFMYLPCARSYAMQSDAETPQGTPAAANGQITFGAVLHYRELNEGILSLWREILEQVPEARLLVVADEFREKAMIVEAEEKFMASGIELKRVKFEGVEGSLLPKYLDMDVFLGTYPVQDSARLMHALFMGVPALVLDGAGFDNRLSMSILSRMGIGELIALSKEAYIAKAVELARDLDRLDGLHKKLRNMLEKASALNPARYVRKLEIELRKIYTSGRF